jgi:hypothetical protein
VGPRPGLCACAVRVTRKQKRAGGLACCCLSAVCLLLCAVCQQQPIGSESGAGQSRRPSSISLVVEHTRQQAHLSRQTPLG